MILFLLHNFVCACLFRWDNETGEPASFSKDWVDLTAAEQEAALNVCFLPELWDENSLADGWNLNYLPLLQGLTAELDAAVAEIMKTFPYTRFLPWDNLSLDIRDIAESEALAYDQRRWDKSGRANIEGYAYYDLCRGWGGFPAGTSSCDVTDGVQALGFDEDSWNCWMLHAPDYEWADLGSYRQWYEVLGWTRDRWDADFAPPSDSTPWFQLTYEEKIAATNLCYIQQVWDEENLPDWAGQYQTLPQGETRAPTKFQPTISPAPTLSPTEPCLDNPDDFQFNGRSRSCSWVASRLGRCTDPMDNGVRVNLHCPAVSILLYCSAFLLTLVTIFHESIHHFSHTFASTFSIQFSLLRLVVFPVLSLPNHLQELLLVFHLPFLVPPRQNLRNRPKVQLRHPRPPASALTLPEHSQLVQGIAIACGSETVMVDVRWKLRMGEISLLSVQKPAVSLVKSRPSRRLRHL